MCILRGALLRGRELTVETIWSCQEAHHVVIAESQHAYNTGMEKAKLLKPRIRAIRTARLSCSATDLLRLACVTAQTIATYRIRGAFTAGRPVAEGLSTFQSNGRSLLLPAGDIRALVLAKVVGLQPPPLES